MLLTYVNLSNTILNGDVVVCCSMWSTRFTYRDCITVILCLLHAAQHTLERRETIIAQVVFMYLIDMVFYMQFTFACPVYCISFIVTPIERYCYDNRSKCNKKRTGNVDVGQKTQVTYFQPSWWNSTTKHFQFKKPSKARSKI